MVAYKIVVKTGDKLGSGTDANVHIILHGKGNQTEAFLLDNFFKNDFESGSIDKFSITSKLEIPEVQRVELWRDNCGLAANWYLDWIEVTNISSGITSIFPGMKWIREGQHYFLKHIDTCLPQNDPYKEKRMVELTTIRKDYELHVKVPGLHAQAKHVPEAEKFSFDYQFDFDWSQEVLTEDVTKQLMAKGLEWKTIDDIKECYTPVFGKPNDIGNFNDDAKFGRQRLIGFGVTEEMLKPLLEGYTIKQTIDAKRLFIVDLALLEGIPTKSPEDIVPCPLVLFYFNKENRLMPVSIQLYQQKGVDNPVFLPTDPEYTWMLAKLWYSVAEATYHQSITHLGNTHFMMEGICVSLKRQLSPSHPVYKLLSPHFLFLIAVNSKAPNGLVKPGGFVDQASNAGVNGFMALMKKSVNLWRLDLDGTLPEELKRRGVFEQSVLAGAYHYRDDALLLYNAIRTYVQKYVSHYYSEEGSLIADYEIQQWGAEVVKSRECGGVGILGVPNNGKFETTDQLVLTVTAIIYTCSVVHAAVNSPQYDQHADPFNYPAIMSGTPPTTKNAVTLDFILKSIPNRKQLLAAMSTTWRLSQKGTQSLGDFEKQLIVDPPAVQIVEEFRQDLRNINKVIEDRNRTREYPYRYLLPKDIPNAISA